MEISTKQKLLKPLLLIACLLCSITASAYDFYVGGIYYNITSSTNKTVEVTCEDNFYYNSYSGSVVIPESVENGGVTYSVTAIGSYAFDYCSGLTSVEIPNSVTTIGERAFEGCSGLTSVEIPNSVTAIGAGTFCGCKGLTSVVIPNSVTTIGDGAFYWCSGLKEFVVGTENTKYSSLEGVLFDKEKKYLIQCPAATKMTEYTIPNSVTTIGENAFYQCSDLTSVVIPNSVNTIGDWAFSGCSGLKSVEIPNSVTTIDYWAFNGCSGLKSVEIPNSVTTIGERAFQVCSSLKEIYNYSLTPQSINTSVFDYVDKASCTLFVPKGTIEKYKAADGWKDFTNIKELTCDFIADGIYYNITSATDMMVEVTNKADHDTPSYSGSVVIPESVEKEGTTYSVTAIGEYAFNACSGLTDVEIPSAVTSIGNYAFSDCSGLTNIEIPNFVTTIGFAAFGKCTGLTSVEIPNSVTTIYDSAFYGCSGLTDVEIPNSVTTIGFAAFGECTGLTEFVVETGNSKYSSLEGVLFDKDKKVLIQYLAAKELTEYTIPNSVTTIDAHAFHDCSGLTSVVIGNSVTTIGEYAFLNCSGLKEIYNYSLTPQSINTNVFSNVNKASCTLFVPKGTIEKYKAANGWKEFTNIKELTYDFIADGIYYNITSATDMMVEVTNKFDHDTPSYSGSVVIPESVENGGTTYSVTSIGEYAFNACSGLTDVEIPNSVTAIGEKAFEGTAWYNNQEDGLVYAGLVAYRYKGTMPENTSIILKEDTKGIADAAFDGCATLKSINIPKSVTYMDYTSFRGCTGLREIYNYSETPQDMHSEKVESINTNKCMLYVPKGCFDIYDTDRYWGWFLNIVEFDATGINTVTNGDVQISVDGGAIVVNGVSDALPVAIYDINGKLVYSGTSKSVAVPANGVYIVKVAGVTKKVSL